MQTQKRFRKKAAAVVSSLLIVALLAGGTFAYFAAQDRVNLFKDTQVFSGGVARDDYEEGGNGNKDVYVENPENNETELYVRIRLEEYLDFLYRTETEPEVLVGSDGATRTPSDAWIGHEDVPAGADGKIPAGTSLGEGNGAIDAHSFWEWIMGGSKVYLPAPASAQAENQSTDTPAYSDTREDYVDGQEYDGITAKTTPVAQVIAYENWNGKAGDFWVLSEDGWFYWANPIMPGSATGLLLNAVNLDEELLPEDWKEYYYAINVLFEFWDTEEADWNENYARADEGGKEVLDAARAKGDEEKNRLASLERLNQLIAQGDEIYGSRNDDDFNYIKTGDEWDIFVATLPASKTWRDANKDTAAQAQIDAKADELEAAINGLKQKALDYDRLDKAIDTANKLNPDEYSQADQKLLEDGIKAAEEARAKTPTTQKEIDDAAKALEDIIAGLEKVVLPIKPSDPTKGFETIEATDSDADKDFRCVVQQTDEMLFFPRTGAIFLEDMLDMTDFTGMEVEVLGDTDKAKFGNYVKIGTEPRGTLYADKTSNAAIILSYQPTLAEFRAAGGGTLEYTISIRLTQNGKSADCKITWSYDGIVI